MSTELCNLWRELAHGATPSVIRRAQALLGQLVEHVEDCASCDAAVASLSEDGLAAVYELLAGDSGAPTDENPYQLHADVDAHVVYAVNELLLPQLTPQLNRTLAWQPLDLYRGIDALAMLIERESRDGAALVRLSPQALHAGVEELPRTTIVKEIQFVTSLDESSSSRLFDWLFAALRDFPKLLPGMIATGRGASVSVRVLPPGEPIDLSLAWAPDVVSVSVRGRAAALADPVSRQLADRD